MRSHIKDQDADSLGGVVDNGSGESSRRIQQAGLDAALSGNAIWPRHRRMWECRRGIIHVPDGWKRSVTAGQRGVTKGRGSSSHVGCRFTSRSSSSSSSSPRPTSHGWPYSINFVIVSDLLTST
ncbi:hypothetical protein KM043_008575 [Ampulex compressa]|nr:hypothetical protein KM043_008575 [Ampulex compressa]